MKRFIAFSIVTGMALMSGGDAAGRGFGGGGFAGARGFSGGGFSGGGFGEGGYRGGDFRAGDSYGGFREGDWSGSHSFNTYSGDRGYGATSSYDRSYTGSRGGSVNVDGERGAGYSPWGGFAAGGTRDVTATGPEGRSYSSDSARLVAGTPWGTTVGGGTRSATATGLDGRSISGTRDGGFAVGPYGRSVGGGERSVTGVGPDGAFHSTTAGGYASGRMASDFGLAHYSSFNTAAVGHSTAYWSHNTMVNNASFVRNNFNYYDCFRRPGWYTNHPGAWFAAGWDSGAAWSSASWASLVPVFAFASPPVYYDYGNTIVYQDNNVYQDGQQIATAEQYSQQATTLADQGQTAPAPPQAKWTSLGVFALTSGNSSDTSSNNVFQIAINSDGVVRGNYYDGLMDTTTPIYGSLDKKTQRVAWTIGKKNDRVFDTGIYNLTKSEAPVLVHIGNTRTMQMLLVRVSPPDPAPGN
jgi:hypothetical protein